MSIRLRNRGRIAAGCMMLCVVLALTLLAGVGKDSAAAPGDDNADVRRNESMVEKARTSAMIKSTFGKGAADLYVVNSSQGDQPAGAVFRNVSVQGLEQIAGHSFLVAKYGGKTLYVRFDQIKAVHLPDE